MDWCHNGDLPPKKNAVTLTFRRRIRSAGPDQQGPHQRLSATPQKFSGRIGFRVMLTKPMPINPSAHQ